MSVVSADREVWSGEARQVVARTTIGEIGILAGHEPVLGDPRRGRGAHHHARRRRHHGAGRRRLPVGGERQRHDRRRAAELVTDCARRVERRACCSSSWRGCPARARARSPRSSATGSVLPVRVGRPDRVGDPAARASTPTSRPVSPRTSSPRRMAEAVLSAGRGVDRRRGQRGRAGPRAVGQAGRARRARRCGSSRWSAPIPSCTASGSSRAAPARAPAELDLARRRAEPRRVGGVDGRERPRSPRITLDSVAAARREHRAGARLPRGADVLILLPPSETKRDGRRRRHAALDFGALSFPALHDAAAARPSTRCAGSRATSRPRPPRCRLGADAGAEVDAQPRDPRPRR